MVDSSVLAQLKDIHLPPEPGFWPLASGWYVLMLLLAVGLSFAFGIMRYKKQNRIKKQALNLLAAYEAQYNKDHNTQLASARISELLKRVALIYFPRQEVAAMHGTLWVAFLTRTSKGVDFETLRSLLLECPFKSNDTQSVKPLFDAAHLWIKQRKKPCLN